jgi:hypothetical protein
LNELRKVEYEMAVLRILVLLAGVVSTLLFPIFLGHALSTHGTTPILLGTIGLLVGAAFIFVSTRMPDPSDHGH